MKPTEINAFLQARVIGQEDTLRFVSVAIFKHVQGERYGNLLMIGNSGTGKTTIMRAMERLYESTEEFHEYRAVVIMNANQFASEEGIVDPNRLLTRLEERARESLGEDATAEEVGNYMEHETVCIDEVDKISATVGGKPYVTGINLHQGLLTLMEGERILFPVTQYRNKQLEKVQGDALIENNNSGWNSQAYLEEATRANLLLIPLDEENRWYRYHHLFQDLLYHKLKAEVTASTLDDLHARASAWFADNDLVDEALTLRHTG